MTELVTWALASLSFAGENLEVESVVVTSSSRAVTLTIGQLVSGQDDPELLLLACVYLSLLFYFLLLVTRAAISKMKKRGGIHCMVLIAAFLLSRLKIKASCHSVGGGWSALRHFIFGSTFLQPEGRPVLKLRQFFLRYTQHFHILDAAGESGESVENTL